MYTVRFISNVDPSRNWVRTFEQWDEFFQAGYIDKHLTVIVLDYASRCEDKLEIAIAMNGETLLITFE